MTLLEWTEKNIASLEQLRSDLLNTGSVVDFFKVEGALEVLAIIKGKANEQDNQSTRTPQPDEGQPRSASLE